ncbi:hypothetical protein L0152_25850 [bacterium]|nr:hypothetical protein [bacterium]
MKIIYSNLWDSDCDIKAVTTNSFVRRDGSLVMGRGAALQAAQGFPELPYVAGQKVLWRSGHLSRYGWLYLPELNIGLFQVKRHWKDNAELRLIKRATEDLCEFMQRHSDISVALNFPGIGNGRLSFDLVKPIVESLPDRVHLLLLNNE